MRRVSPKRLMPSALSRAVMVGVARIRTSVRWKKALRMVLKESGRRAQLPRLKLFRTGLVGLNSGRVAFGPSNTLVEREDDHWMPRFCTVDGLALITLTSRATCGVGMSISLSI